MGIFNKNEYNPVEDYLYGDLDATPIQKGEIAYTGEATKLFELGAVKADKPAAGKELTLFDWDIAQSHFFTIQISKLTDKNGKMFSFASGVYKNYIPVKTMNLSYTAYDNMAIPLAIFGDFPIPHRKRMSTISLTCYDLDMDIIEDAIKRWENQCFPQQKYVAYLDDIKAEFTYTSYDVKGKVNFSHKLLVIPASSVSVSRSYEENGAKILNFSLVAVGDCKGTNANGNKGERERIGILGPGDGNATYDKYAELSVSAAIPRFQR